MKPAEIPHRKTTGRYFVTYLCILIIALLQFVVALTSSGNERELLARLLILAFIEAVLAVLFFMHLWTDNRGLLWFVVIFTGFVLLAMQYGWTDSFRILNGVPWAR
ncbi:MAG TPA: cytochrome C oxidase subunit IV family protein [Candidatus Eisenbacteria bacterium]|nr:cytochrome C oxidase subunit IV family protein [Candidatus Eisenbacteria bacterium]